LSPLICNKEIDTFLKFYEKGAAFQDLKLNNQLYMSSELNNLIQPTRPVFKGPTLRQNERLDQEIAQMSNVTYDPNLILDAESALNNNASQLSQMAQDRPQKTYPKPNSWPESSNQQNRNKYGYGNRNNMPNNNYNNNYNTNNNYRNSYNRPNNSNNSQNANNNNNSQQSANDRTVNTNNAPNTAQAPANATTSTQNNRSLMVSSVNQLNDLSMPQ